MKRKVWLITGVTVFIGLIVVVSALFMSDDPFSDYNYNFDHRNIPENIANYQLFNEVGQEEVSELMNSLLRKDVNLDQTYILEYGNLGGGHSIVWIAESNIEGKPDLLVDQMKEIFSSENTLLHFGERSISGQTVYHGVDSLGRGNYFFTSNNRFIFITTYEDTRDTFIKNAVRVF